MQSRLRSILCIIAGFFALGFLIYGWSLGNDFVRWDDGMLIYENPAIRQITPATLWWIFTHFDPELYIPLTFLTYQIEYAIGGAHPFLFHFDSLVLHILNALLVVFVVYALIKKSALVTATADSLLWIALFCGAVFLVHPLNTEGVEWASGRKDVLSTFFFLASIGSYFLYRNRDSRSWYIVSIVLFLCGLLSKVMIITLPVVLVLFDYAEHRRLDRRFVLEKIPYVLLSILFGLIGILGKENVLASTTVWEKILMAFKSIAFYPQQFLLPFRFSLLYPYTSSITIASSDFFVPMIIVFSACVIALLLRNRLRLVTVGFALYIVTVAPTLLNFAKGEMDLYFASDRYAYVPQIGLILVLAGLIGRYSSGISVRVMGGILSAVLLVLSVLSYRQSLVWANTETLFQNVIRQFPDASYVAYNNLCNAKRLAGRLDEAVQDCLKSIELRKNAQTYSNLGAIYRKQKQYAEALATYEQAIAQFPKSRFPHFGIGIVYAETGQFAQAEAAYKKAIELWPSYQDAHLNLGALYAMQGKYHEAISEYTIVLGYNAFHPTALFNLAVAESELGKTEDAMRNYERAIAADPRQIAARINLGLLLYTTGKREEAVGQFQAVLSIDPNNAAARSALRQLGE